jgi:putative transcriptional regulator
MNNRVRELRAVRNGMTQQELADEVGVTRQTIVALERAA